MQSIFSNALSEAVAKHIDLSATRRETIDRQNPWLAGKPQQVDHHARRQRAVKPHELAADAQWIVIKFEH